MKRLHEPGRKSNELGTATIDLCRRFKLPRFTTDNCVVGGLLQCAGTEREAQCVLNFRNRKAAEKS